MSSRRCTTLSLLQHPLRFSCSRNGLHFLDCTAAASLLPQKQSAEVCCPHTKVQLYLVCEGSNPLTLFVAKEMQRLCKNHCSSSNALSKVPSRSAAQVGYVACIGRCQKVHTNCVKDHSTNAMVLHTALVHCSCCLCPAVVAKCCVCLSTAYAGANHREAPCASYV